MKNWIAGFVAGALLFMLVPAQAHHRDDRFAKKIRNLQAVVYRHTNDIFTLKSKTQFMDTQGFYYAPILDEQVLSFDCQVGDDAIWVGDLEFDVRFLKCTEGPYQQARGLKAFVAGR